jgi:cytidyltransferase-like protein
MAKTVLVFGTFDGLHEGHRFFLTQAKKHGDRLVAVVARDQSVRVLKGKEPNAGEEKRRLDVSEHPDVDEALLGDEALGSYEIVSRVMPDAIALGHDQHALSQDLAQWIRAHGERIQLVTIPFYDGPTGKKG